MSELINHEEDYQFRILVVDDVEHVRDKVSNIISGMGLPCVSAADGFEALRLVSEFPDISLIITDYNLGVINGIEFLARVNGDDERDIPAIFLTSEIPSDTDKTEAKSYKGIMWMFKPVYEQSIVEAINAVKKEEL